jgi:hypothetical protein
MCCRNNCTLRDRPDVLKTVNALLEKKYSAHKIEKLIGIGHSIIGRHSFHCWTKLAAEKIRLERERKRHPVKTKIVVWWPENSKPNLRENELLVKVVYEQQHIANPQGLMVDGVWTADAQKSFLELVTPEVQRKYILGQHEDALLENAERNAAKNQTATIDDLKVSSNGNTH